MIETEEGKGIGAEYRFQRMRLENKLAVVTGGASGIGASTGVETIFTGSFGGSGVLDCQTRMAITTTTIVHPAPRKTNHRSSFDFIGVILNDL